MTTNPTDEQVEALKRTSLEVVMLAAWVGVEPHQLPDTKEWIYHPSDTNAQAWRRVGEAAEKFFRLQSALPAPSREGDDAAFEVLARIRTAYSEVGADLTTVERTRVLRSLLSYSDFRALSYLARASAPPSSIPMILHCPACRLQHVDTPEWADERRHGPDDRVFTPTWTNPPHRSHLCHGCGHIWRPADVPTEGVAAIQTRGKADSAPPSPVGEGWVLEAAKALPDELPDWLIEAFERRMTEADYRAMRAEHAASEASLTERMAGGNWLVRASQWLHAMADQDPPYGSRHHVSAIIANVLYALSAAAPAPPSEDAKPPLLGDGG